MGESQSYGLLIGTTIYFFAFYLIVWASINAEELDNSQTGDAFTQSDLRFNNPGFQTDAESSISTNNTGYSGFTATFSAMSGVGRDKVDIGEPSEYSWIYNFILFWIPLCLFIAGLYFALPFLH